MIYMGQSQGYSVFARPELRDADRQVWNVAHEHPPRTDTRRPASHPVYAFISFPVLHSASRECLRLAVHDISVKMVCRGGASIEVRGCDWPHSSSEQCSDHSHLLF